MNHRAEALWQRAYELATRGNSRAKHVASERLKVTDAARFDYGNQHFFGISSHISKHADNHLLNVVLVSVIYDVSHDQ